MHTHQHVPYGACVRVCVCVLSWWWCCVGVPAMSSAAACIQRSRCVALRARVCVLRPAVVLLLQALQAWRASLGPDTPPSRLPANASERSAFRAALNSLRRSAGEEGLFVEVGACACATDRACVCVRAWHVRTCVRCGGLAAQGRLKKSAHRHHPPHAHVPGARTARADHDSRRRTTLTRPSRQRSTRGRRPAYVSAGAACGWHCRCTSTLCQGASVLLLPAPPQLVPASLPQHTRRSPRRHAHAAMQRLRCARCWRTLQQTALARPHPPSGCWWRHSRSLW
jgi:hypothetical protein